MYTPRLTTSHETSPSFNREGVERRWAIDQVSIDLMKRAYVEMVPEDLIPKSVTPSREVQEYAAKLAASKQEAITPETLVAERQAVAEALDTKEK